MGKQGLGERTFNGEKYQPQQYFSRKSDARDFAVEMRTRGYKARVVRVKGGCMVYFRGRGR